MATKKVIAIIRSSTEKQEVESQKKEITDYIIADKVKKEDIIYVGHEGASAYKIDDAYKENMKTVFDLIDSGNISTVYAWAIDRIGRNEYILFKFKKKLTDNGIQLIIKNPQLRLLRDDGSIDTGVEIAFSVFATMAKQEIETKIARTERAKKRNAEQGRFNGGKYIHYGYFVDKDKRIQVCEEEAELVRLIYDLYSSGKYSMPTLADELQSRGYRNRGNPMTFYFINKVLRSTAYIGYTDNKKLNTRRVYPRIISDDLFHKVQKQKQDNFNGDITKQSKNKFLATKLIVCPKCGRHFVATDRSYVCTAHKNHIDYNCDNGTYISILWMDIAAWHVAKTCEMTHLITYTDSKVEETKKQIEINCQKISAYDKQINDKDKKRKRIAKMFINEAISEEDQEYEFAKLDADVEKYRQQIIELQEQNRKLSEFISYGSELIHMGRLPISGVYEDRDNAYDICHRYIKKITVEPYEYNGRMEKIINITTIWNEEHRFLYKARNRPKKGKKPTKLYKERDGKFEPLVAYAEFVQPDYITIYDEDDEDDENIQKPQNEKVFDKE